MKTSKQGFTLLELLVVLAIVIILAILSAGGIKNALEKARMTQCIANLKTLWQGTMAYANEHDGALPVDTKNNATGMSWYMELHQGSTKYVPHPGYGSRKAPYFCKANKPVSGTGNVGWTNYAMNSNLQVYGSNLGKVPEGEDADAFKGSRHGSRLIALPNKALYLDSSDGKGGSWYTVAGARYNKNWTDTHAVHGDRINVVFLDGHIESPKVFPRTLNADGDLNELKASWFWPIEEPSN